MYCGIGNEKIKMAEYLFSMMLYQLTKRAVHTLCLPQNTHFPPVIMTYHVIRSDRKSTMIPQVLNIVTLLLAIQCDPTRPDKTKYSLDLGWLRLFVRSWIFATQ